MLSAAPSPAASPQPTRPATIGGAAGFTFVHWPAATRVYSVNAPIPSAGESSCPASGPTAIVMRLDAWWVSKQYHGRPRRHARHRPQTARQLRIT